MQTLLEIEHAMRYGLRMWEVVSVEMRRWRVGEFLFSVLSPSSPLLLLLLFEGLVILPTHFVPFFVRLGIEF